MRSMLTLGLAAVTIALAAPAQVDAAAPAGTPALTALLADLDARFARGDVTGYLAAFAPDHPGAHALLRRQLERLLGCGKHVERSSALLTTPRRIGARTVVRVRHTIHAGDRTIVDDGMLAVRETADGRLEPTFLVEIPAQWGCVRDDHFRCPPCNYEVGGVPGWLCVPVRPERARSLEAASFYLVGTDIACDVSVVVDSDAPPAATVVRELAEALHAQDAGAEPGPVEAWLPPAHADAPPSHFAAARQQVSLPHDFDGRGGVAVLYVVTLGSLQHLLLVRGSRTALRERDADVRAMLGSYRMLQTDLDLALAAAEPLLHHTGGSLTEGRYQNGQYGFHLTGPAGWHAQQRCGGAALRVLWTSATGSRLWLTGYGVPAGHERWQPHTADQWLQQLVQQAGLVAVATENAAHWTEQPHCGSTTRTLTCTARSGSGTGAPAERTIRAFLHDQLLLVADLHAVSAADAAAMQQALESLRRD